MLWLRLDVEDRCRDGGCRMDGFWCGREQLLWLAIVDAIAGSDWGKRQKKYEHPLCVPHDQLTSNTGINTYVYGAKYNNIYFKITC